ncbi:MFS transporter [Paraburkholderia bonniea]|uniref:MFS transporter n=1 Tax=Paraburkholderia bonniea TaxID=2152891 RepID=UPI0025742713|nr:MFS transporter [Paraburkholderia bonniea]WJF90269.1 MFS transporter [Paraburkholderia bonniea]WJF93584.1 MFS transporter [Paraburkholderia bonniea]
MAENSLAGTADVKAGISREDRKVILASSLGTIFEWYDFYLYGSLAVVISRQFFAGVNEATGFVFALLAFAAGFIVRPFGAIFFGRLGDIIGRKHTFLVTMLLMGLSTLAVGLLPNYAAIGVAAPILLITARLLQGLALGGEYGGAAVYVAEHAPASQRGYYTSWIQTTATIGLLLSLAVILGCRLLTGDAFDTWGWRIPFWVSIGMLAVSMWIRLSMHESPAFLRMKAEGKLSKAPLREVFGERRNLAKLLIALFGMIAGMTVVWYTGQFYVLYFMTQSLRLDPMSANLLLGAALLLGSPFFIFFGALSDRIGRKPVMLAGMLAAAILLMPLFKGLTQAINPQIAAAAQTSRVVVAADPAQCHVQFDLLGQRKNTSECDQIKAFLAKAGVPYRNQTLNAGDAAHIWIGTKQIEGFDPVHLKQELNAAHYPAQADPAQVNYPLALALLFALILLVTMVYSPLAAALVEMFPTRIRYTALSVPYHVGVGWIGGLLPTISFSLVTATGDMYFGLWYPVAIAAFGFVVGLVFVRETRGVDIEQN